MFSCNEQLDLNETILEDEEIIFYGDKTIYIGNTCLEIDEKQGILKYDDVCNKLWYYKVVDNQVIFRSVKHGVITEEIIIDEPNLTHISSSLFFVTNNIALVSAGLFQNKDMVDYACINLSDKSIQYIKKPHDVRYSPIYGFKENKLIGKDWVFDAATNELIKLPQTLSYYVYMPSVDKFIALSKENTIIIYDYNKGTFFDTKITRKIDPNTFVYLGVYYITDNDFLYFSKPRPRTLEEILYKLIGLGAEPRKWYKYNFSDKSIVQVRVPYEFAIILGSL
jgi:hypothetical protein